MPQLDLKLFGGFQAQLDGQPLQQFRSLNTQGLLIYLALQAERPWNRDLLAGLLWPGQPNAKAKKNLRQTIYQLRQLLNDSDDLPQPFLLTTRHTAQFNPEAALNLDVHQFLAALESGELETAAALYGGDLLAGHAYVSSEFESWLRQERERYHHLALHTLQDLGKKQFDNRQFEAAQATARRLLTFEPWRESAHQLLMRALMQTGDRSGALAQFEQCQQILERELGVSPSQETFDLVQRIEDGNITRINPELVAGQYEMGTVIGQGGMGLVFRGVHRKTREPVAIKVLDHGRITRQPELLERFLREAHALKQLNHPNIVTYLDEEMANGRYALVMEYVDGGNLRQQLDKTPQLPLDQIVSLALDLVDALTRSHRLGILHRDIKPSNVLLSRDGTPLLSDFGLARLNTNSNLTQSGTLMGTIAYMSPEACLGETLDERTDIWSLGVLLYELVFGVLPFQKDAPIGTLLAIINDSIPDFSGISFELPTALINLIKSMLVKDRENRISSIRRVGVILESIDMGQSEELTTVSNIIHSERNQSPLNLIQSRNNRIQLRASHLGQSIKQTNNPEQILLHKVSSFWIEGVLQKALIDGQLLQVNKKLVPHLVTNPLTTAASQIYFDESGQSTDRSIEQIFEENGRSLLILGEPGAGKTVLLLELTHYLINEAQSDPNGLLPVIFNLASWAEKKLPLHEWIIEELNEKYLIPRKIGRRLIYNEQLILLLDGLDEIKTNTRSGCVQTINQFRQNNGLVPVVVCCRDVDYQSIGIQLKLNNAIMLNPLSPNQTSQFLSQSEQGHLQVLIEEDTVLQEIAQSPLMLKVINKTFQKTAENRLLNTTKLSSYSKRREILLETIFASYIQLMLNQVHHHKSVSERQMHQWLSWLAFMMSKQNQSLFLIEKLQPSWLNGHYQRLVYMVSSRLVLGITVGLVLWLFGLVGPTIGINEHSKLSLIIYQRSTLPIPLIDFFMSLLIHSFLGFVVAIVEYYIFEGRIEIDKNNGWDLKRKTAVAGIVGLIYTGFLVAVGESLNLMILQVGGTIFMFALFSHLAFGQHYTNDVDTVEALGWSWRESIKGTIPSVVSSGVFILVIWQFLSSQITLLQIVILLGVPIALLVWILLGFTPKIVEIKTEPNQGIRLSMKSALIGGGIGAIFTGILSLFGTLILRSQGFSSDLTFPIFASLAALCISALIFGGFNVINHYLLRFLISHFAQIPFNFLPFLNSSVRHVLMYQVGGGFIFIHRLLQEHLAKKYSERLTEDDDTNQTNKELIPRAHPV